MLRKGPFFDGLVKVFFRIISIQSKKFHETQVKSNKAIKSRL